MIEPNWEQVPQKFNRSARVHDLVWVVKKTRGRFGPGSSVAQIGDHGLVVSAWMSSMGSLKLCFVNPELRELCVTDTCVYVWGTVDDHPEWADIRKRWMDETYVPMIVLRELSSSRRSKAPYVAARNGGAVLVTPMGSQSKIWLNRDKVHPGDWELMISSQSRCHSVRVPIWMAKKAGIL